MIDQNERVIIVMGMAHSGTTILTYLLSQHPEIFCFVDAEPAFLLENTLLPDRNSKKIRYLLRKKSTAKKRILLKRPWATYYTGWLLSEMPGARYIYCQRSFEDISISWSKPGSYVNGVLRDGSSEFQQNHYNDDLRRAEDFESQAKHFKRFNHKNLLAEPAIAMNELSKWLGLSFFEWDVSKVSKENNIKSVIHGGTLPIPENPPAPEPNVVTENLTPKIKNREKEQPSLNTMIPTPIPARRSPKVIKSKISRKG